MTWFKKREDGEREEKEKWEELKFSDELWIKCNSCNQMAKTSAALAKLHEARIPYISVLTDPTTGGVSASIGMLGDIIIAEPKAMVGFAGPRVIKDTIRSELPEGFQRAEYLLQHGMIDLIVERKDLRHTLALLLGMLGTEDQRH